jgi:hypothetical protein
MKFPLFFLLEKTLKKSGGILKKHGMCAVLTTRLEGGAHIAVFKTNKQANKQAREEKICSIS